MPGLSVRDSLRETLTGPRSISFSGWLSTLVPASILVVVQEAMTPFPTFLLVLLSAAVQHSADGLLAVVALAVQRRFPRLDRIVVRVLLWTSIGISRGLISGAWAAAFAGIAPDFGFRIAFWVLVTWTWMPAIGYTLGQLDARRELLGVRDAERADLDRERDADSRTRGTLRSSLLDAVQQTVRPAVDEIRDRLLRMGESLDPAATGAIGTRITGVVEEAARIVRGVPQTGSVAAPQSSGRAPAWAAIAFDQRRPLWGAAVMAIGMATLLLPDTVRVAGATGALNVALGIAASVTVVLAATLLERVVRVRSRAAQLTALVVRVLAAGAAGTLTILLLGGRSDDEIVLVAALLPIVAGLAAAIVPTVVGIRRANVAVLDEIELLRAERQRLRSAAHAEETRVRVQLAELLHGPIQGRLSACAMALSFHAAATTPPDAHRTAFISTSVLDHLAAVTRDLEALANAPRRSTGDLPGQGGGTEEAPG